MAPKKQSSTSSPKKAQASMKQARLSFKSKKRGAAAFSQAKAKATSRAKVKPESESESEDNEPIAETSLTLDGTGPKTLDRRDKANAYKIYRKEAKKLMGWIPPIHAEGQDDIDHMLRVFDNTYDYGPCVGMTRLERWERANTLGLNPPNEVRDILLTKEGTIDPGLVYSVFEDQVL